MNLKLEHIETGSIVTSYKSREEVKPPTWDNNMQCYIGSSTPFLQFLIYKERWVYVHAEDYKPVEG